jgi:hypothetical protein
MGWLQSMWSHLLKSFTFRMKLDNEYVSTAGAKSIDLAVSYITVK